MPSTSDVFAIRRARPSPTQVAFEIPSARRIRRRSPPCWATTWAARARTTAASVGSPCWSSPCASTVRRYGAPERHDACVPDEVEVLHGGVANAGEVVRIGADVVRPAPANSATIHRLLHHLVDSGLTIAPEPRTVAKG